MQPLGIRENYPDWEGKEGGRKWYFENPVHSGCWKHLFWLYLFPSGVLISLTAWTISKPRSSWEFPIPSLFPAVLTFLPSLRGQGPCLAPTQSVGDTGSIGYRLVTMSLATLAQFWDMPRKFRAMFAILVALVAPALYLRPVLWCSNVHIIRYRNANNYWWKKLPEWLVPAN